MTQPLLLQLCPFSETLERDLAETFDVCRYFALADANAWLAQRGADVVAIATGGQIGTPTALIERLPALGIIAINGVGYDKVDLNVAQARNVRVTTTPRVLTDDVADLAVGLTIAMLRGIVAADRHIRSGAWPSGERPLSRTVTGKRFGIVGLGQIGAAISARLSVFGSVAYTGPHEKPVTYRYQPDLRALAEEVDVLVLASAASAATFQMIDASVLKALGPDGYIVNVGRGSLIDEAALIAALQERTIAGAALDVFVDEPRVPEGLIAMPEVVLTPHIASATRETRQRMAELVVENLRAFVAGQPLPSALV